MVTGLHWTVSLLTGGGIVWSPTKHDDEMSGLELVLFKHRLPWCMVDLIRWVAVDIDFHASRFFFSQRNIFIPVETYIEIGLQSDRNPWENFHRLFQPKIRSLNHPFKSLIRKILIQSQIHHASIFISLTLWVFRFKTYIHIYIYVWSFVDNATLQLLFLLIFKYYHKSPTPRVKLKKIYDK